MAEVIQGPEALNSMLPFWGAWTALGGPCNCSHFGKSRSQQDKNRKEPEVAEEGRVTL